MDDLQDFRPFACDSCDKRFKLKQHLQFHTRTHTGERPYECSYCSKTFAMDYTRKQHENSLHIKDLKYECPQCLQKFYTRPNLNTHANRHHQLSKLFDCPQCLKHFATQFLLNAHVKDVHGEKNHECVPCNVNFSRKTHLLTHFKSLRHIKATMNSRSKICVFSTENSLDGMEEPTKSSKCENCSKSYSTKGSLSRHQIKRGHTTKKGSKVIPFIGLPVNRVLQITPSYGKSAVKIRSEKSLESRKKPEKKEVQAKPLIFECKICAKSYKTKDQLKKHKEKRDHTTEKGSRVISQNGLPVKDVVQVTGHDELPKINSVKSLKSRKGPEEENAQPKPLTFGCQTCSKSYKTKERLERHGERRGHLTKKKSKAINEISHLDGVNNSDEGTRSDVPLQEEDEINVQGESFGCSTCPKSYKTRARLERHCARRGHAAGEESEVTNKSRTTKKQQQVKMEVDSDDLPSKTLKRTRKMEIEDKENRTKVSKYDGRVKEENGTRDLRISNSPVKSHPPKQKDPKKLHPCPFCDKRFKSILKVQKHLAKH